MSAYLTRLQARRAALTAQAVAAPAAEALLVCPRCDGRVSWIGGAEQVLYCTPCAREVPVTSVVELIAELDRAITWARQVAGVEGRR